MCVCVVLILNLNIIKLLQNICCTALFIIIEQLYDVTEQGDVVIFASCVFFCFSQSSIAPFSQPRYNESIGQPASYNHANHGNKLMLIIHLILANVLLLLFAIDAVSEALLSFGVCHQRVTANSC